MRPRILLVDDDANIRAGIRNALERKGWEVDDMATPEKALESFTPELYDAISTDFDMGAGHLNGAQLAAAVLKKFPGAKVFLISGSDEAQLLARRLGVTFFFKGDILDYVSALVTLRDQLAYCSCRDCSAAEKPCQGDCTMEDPCTGCRESAEALKDDEFEAAKAQGRL